MTLDTYRKEVVIRGDYTIRPDEDIIKAQLTVPNATVTLPAAWITGKPKRIIDLSGGTLRIAVANGQYLVGVSSLNSGESALCENDGLKTWHVYHGGNETDPLPISFDGSNLFVENSEGQTTILGAIGTDQVQAGDTLGDVVGSIEIFDRDGVSLGFLPLYDSVTVGE